MNEAPTASPFDDITAGFSSSLAEIAAGNFKPAADVPFGMRGTDARAGKLDVTPTPVVEQDNPLVRGYNAAKSSALLFGNLTTGNYEDAAKNLAEQDRYVRANPGSDEAIRLSKAWESGDGISGGLSNVGDSIANDYNKADGLGAGVAAVGRNLKAMGSGVLAQAPNMVLPLVGMGAGAVAGSAVAGPVGTVAGGYTGATAGNAMVGASEAAMRHLKQAGIDPQDTAAVAAFLKKSGDQILKDTAVKGAIIGAVDTATMGLSHFILTAPTKAAVERGLIEMGVDLADHVAVTTAMKSPKLNALVKQDPAFIASKSGPENVARNVSAGALEPLGEFGGELVGDRAVTGEWDEKGAFLEGVSSLGQSAVTVAGQKAYAGIKYPFKPDAAPNPVAESAEKTGSVLSRAAIAGNPGMAQLPVLTEPGDPFTARANEVATAVQEGGLLDKLRDIGQPGTVTEFLDALTQARNPNTPPAVRQQAIESLNTAMGWIESGQMPNAPANGSPFSTDLTVTPAPGTDLAPTQGGQLTDPGMPAAFDPNVVDVDATRVDNMLDGPKALSAPPRAVQTITPTNPAPAGFSTSGEPTATPETPRNVNAPTQAQQTKEEGPQAPAASVTPPAPVAPPAAPAAHKQVTAPAVKIPEGQGTAQERKRKAQLQAMASDGFDTVERQADGSFYLINPRRNEALKLDNMGDAQRARKAIADHIDGASNQANKKPTDAQIEAENYKKGHLTLNGFDIAIENPRHGTRSGTSPDGKKWTSQMAHHYGYFKRTLGADGDAVDVFIGSRPDSSTVYVVDQNNRDGSFDEHKVMMGFNDIESARKGYLDNYEKGWMGLGAITEMPLSIFKTWVKSEAAKKPAAQYDQSQSTKASNDTRGSTSTGIGTDSGLPASAQGSGASLAGSQDQRTSTGTLPGGSSGATAESTAAADARAKNAVAQIAEQLKATGPVALADSQREDVKALNGLLDVFSGLTGKRGYATVGDAVGDGVSNGVDFFVNVDKPQMHVGQTIAHEFKHLSNQFPGIKKLYDRLWDMVSPEGRRIYFETYLKKGRSFDSATQAELELLKDEMIADFIGKRFNDREWLDQLSKQKPKLFGDFVRDWIAALSNLISGLRGMDRHMKGVKNVDAYISELQKAKAIAMEVATAWAERNPKMAAESRGAPQHSARNLDMAAFLKEQAELQDELQAEQDAPEIQMPGVTEAAIKAKGLMAEEAFPVLQWVDTYKDGTRFDVSIPELQKPGSIASITLEQHPEGAWGATMSGTWIGPSSFGRDGYTTLEAVKAFAHRYVASYGLQSRGFDLANTSTPAERKTLLAAWNAMNQLNEPGEGVRRYGQVSDDSRVLRAMANDMGVTEVYDLAIDAAVSGPDHRTLSVEFVNKVTGDKQGAYLEFGKDGDHYLGRAHTEGLRRGGVGAAFYQMMGEYAARHNIQIEADFALSGVNSYRRTEQMLSTALRTGKSNVLTPHTAQRIYGFENDAETPKQHQDNLARMLLAGLRNVREIAPEMDGLHYFPETGLFLTADGEDADVQVAQLLGDPDVRAFGLGRSTLARAVMTRMVMDGQLDAKAVTSFYEPVLYSARDDAVAEYAMVDAKYRDTPQWMKAPNGEDTLLNERQWVQVRTPSFQKWFGPWEKFADGSQAGVWNDDKGEVSKVVDKNGEPLVVYHGTDKGGFYKFRMPGGVKRGDLGIFTTSNKQMADTYVHRRKREDITPPTNRDDLEAMGAEFFEEDGSHYYSDVNGNDSPWFTTETAAVADALKNFEGNANKAAVYATFMNLRNPNEDDFQGAFWSGERHEQYEVYNADGDVEYNADGNEFMTQEEAMELADEIGGSFEPASPHYNTTDSVVREGYKGHDGTIVRNVIDNGSGDSYYDNEPADVFVAQHPEQLKSADWNTGEFGPTADMRFSLKDPDFTDPEDRLTVSTTQPTAKPDRETGYQPNSYSEKRVIDTQDILDSKTHVKTIVAALRKYNTLTGKGSSKVVMKELHDLIVKNLLWLHDRVDPAVRERAKLWYDGANKIASEWAEKYNLDARQTSAMLAVYSPQMDWFRNVSLADRTLVILKNHGNETWSPGMTAWAESWLKSSTKVSEKTSRTADLIEMRRIQAEGKALSEMSNEDAGYFVRAFDEAYFPRTYRLITPEGGMGDFALKNDGAKLSVTWGSFETAVKAVSVFRDGTFRNIDTQLGGEHKVRNFYNNIIDPNNADNHITIDTHAVAAGLLKALSGSSEEVKHNLGGLGSTAATGASGSYALFADAYRDAADQRNLLAREMQSITWEAIRALFHADVKKVISAPVSAVWDRVKSGELTRDQALEEIQKISGPVRRFEWENSDQGSFVKDGASSFDADIAANPDDRGVRTKPPEDAKDKISISLSAATDKIPGIKVLYDLAQDGDKAAHTLLQDITKDGLEHLLSGTSARLQVEPATGLYGGASEPSLGVTVTFTDSDRPAVLAALAQFADNFSQEQVHVRQGTKVKVGVVFEDGSYATPVYRWDLKKSLSTKQIQAIIDKSGLYGLTFGDTFIEAYFVGDTHDESAVEQFERNIERATSLVGRAASGSGRTVARLWPYGDGAGAIGYDHIRGDVTPGQAAYSETARRVAAYLAGVEKVKTFQNTPVTAKQDTLQSEIAKVYESLPDNDLANPRVKKAYTEAAREVLRQFKALPIKVEVQVKKNADKTLQRVDGKLVASGFEDGEPYTDSPAMRRDVLDNNHLFIFATTPDTFGPEGSDFTGHPLLDDSGLKDINGYPLLYNDLLRAVHDYFAHTMSPTSFGPVGEEAAWKNHISMTRNMWARWALTSETRGQNSWVNFRQDLNRATPISQRDFARQKVVLLPAVYMLTGDAKIDVPTKAFIESLPEKQRIGSKPMFSARIEDQHDQVQTPDTPLRAAVQDDGLAEPAGGHRSSPGTGEQRGAAPPVAGRDHQRGASGFPDQAIRVEGAIHYGRRPGLSFLSGSQFNSGIKGAEQARVAASTDKRIKSRVYFYIPVAVGIPQAEIGLGSNVYRTDLSGVYDTATRAVRGNSSEFESAVLDAGYSGIMNREQGTIVMFADVVPVSHIGNASDFQITQRVIQRAQSKNETRTEGQQLVRRPDNTQQVDIIRNRAVIEAAAPSFVMRYAEARVLASESEAADQAFNEIGSTFQFGKPMYSVRAPQDLFVSQLSQQVEKASMNQAPAGAWKSFIKALNQKGVKADEIEWSGVNEWLDLQEGKVSRQALVDYLKSNGVQVTETVKGGELFKSADTAIAFIALEKGESEDWVRDNWGYTNERDYITLADGMASDGGVDNTKYSQYTLPGGKNYREVLLTLPGDDSEAKMAAETKAAESRMFDIRVEIREENRKPSPNAARLTSLQEEYKKLDDQIDALTNALSKAHKRTDVYRSNHWDQTNVLAHIRLNDRLDAEGKRVLFVEEIQSDWGQDGKKKGFTNDAAIKGWTAKRAAGDPMNGGELWEIRDARGNWVVGIPVANEPDEKRAMLRAAGLNPKGVATVPVAPFVTKTDAWLSLALKRVIGLAVDGGYDKVAFVNGDQSAERYDLSKQVSDIQYTKAANGKYYIVVGGPNGGIHSGRHTAEELENYVGKELAQRIVDRADDSMKELSGLDLKVGGEGMKAFYNSIVPNIAKDVVRKLGGGKLEEVKLPTGSEYQYFSGMHRKTISGREMQSQPGFTITPDMRAKVDAGVPLFSKRQHDEPAKTKPKKAGKYAGKKVSIPVKIEDTGEVATLIMDVEQTLDDFDKRQANMKELLGCLK